MYMLFILYSEHATFVKKKCVLQHLSELIKKQDYFIHRVDAALYDKSRYSNHNFIFDLKIPS